ncbi:MAG: Asp-tRNA(Asn)/Glu-tRNA(Gln) amidotransferase subunit GatA [Planctomycetes bacterium]|nr:Asp-tRNA(Asn)/Glu-tRNA(Gln) amidotransferase subunit GatA [Planctomycetota bacterium]
MILSASQLVESVQGKKRSAREVVQESLEAIERADAAVGAFLSVDADGALARASEVDESIARGENPGRLAGLPVALKDNLCTIRGTTTCASAALANFRSPYNAHVVDRLEADGAIIIGKTNLDEFAMGSSTENSGRFPTRNPWNLDCVPGGSSGGSAAAVASGMVPVALGSETGGSVRQPASLCGVVGLKPTYGRVSRYGLVAFASSLDQIGPFGRTAEDVALLLNSIAGYDSRDSTSVNTAVPDYTASLDRPLNGMRVGVPGEYFGDGLDAQVKVSVEAAIDVLGSHGVELVEVHLPHMQYAVACYYILASAEASSNLARFDGGHYGRRSAEPGDIMNLYASSRGEGFGSEVKRRIMLGTHALSSGYHEAYYLKALKVRTLIMRDFDRAFDRVDVIASPAAPTPAFPIGEKTDDPLAMYLSDTYTLPASLAGICAVSVPCGFSSDGLPIGLQLMGPAFGEERLLSVAHQYQQLTEHHTKWPSPATAA